MNRPQRVALTFLLTANFALYTVGGLLLLLDGTGPWLAALDALARRPPASAALGGSRGVPRAVAQAAIAPGTPAPPARLKPGPVLPAAAEVTGVDGHRQSLPLSCEARSAADWADFFGVDIDEREFLASLPRSDDPDRGFVGDVRGRWGQIPPDAYGVHAGPVARRLRDYGLPAEAHRFYDWDEVRAEIAAGRPVIVWVVGHVDGGEPVIYTAADGRRTVVARYEHTVIVVGYDETSVTVVDGARTYARPLDVFLESWGVLRNQAITAER